MSTVKRSSTSTPLYESCARRRPMSGSRRDWCSAFRTRTVRGPIVTTRKGVRLFAARQFSAGGVSRFCRPCRMISSKARAGRGGCRCLDILVLISADCDQDKCRPISTVLAARGSRQSPDDFERVRGPGVKRDSFFLRAEIQEHVRCPRALHLGLEPGTAAPCGGIHQAPGGPYLESIVRFQAEEGDIWSTRPPGDRAADGWP